MKTNRRLAFFLWVALSAVWLGGTAWGQATGSGTINGTVTDPRQAAVPGS